MAVFNLFVCSISQRTRRFKVIINVANGHYMRNWVKVAPLSQTEGQPVPIGLEENRRTEQNRKTG